MSEAKRIVGKEEKSKGRSMNSVTVKIKMASAKLAARPTSSTIAGIGRIIMTMIAIRARASRTVGWKMAEAVTLGNAYPPNNVVPRPCPTGTNDPGLRPVRACGRNRG